eukprot:jgi/Ulvmu1/4116/UM019_0095.1
MVDVPSATGPAAGRSQRSKSRVDYTSQIYVAVRPKKDGDTSAASKARQRVSQDDGTEGPKNTGRKNAPPQNSVSARTKKASSGKHRREHGHDATDKSTVQPAAIAAAIVEADDSRSIKHTSSLGKRTRGSGGEREYELPTKVSASPAQKRRKRKGENAAAAGRKENVDPAPHQEDQPAMINQGKAGSDASLKDGRTATLDPPHPFTLGSRSKPKAGQTIAEPGTSRHEPELAQNNSVVLDVAGDAADVRARTGARAGIPTRVVQNPQHAPRFDRGWDDVNAIFAKQPRQASSLPTLSQVNVDQLENLIDESNQQRLRAAQEEVRVLTAENKQKAACIRQLRDDLERKEALHFKHDMKVSKQMQNYETNYRMLYERFHKQRSWNCEEAQQILEGFWRTMQEQSDVIDQLTEVREAEAGEQTRELHESGVGELKEELQAKNDKVISLENQLVQEAGASLLQAQELANLRHMVDCLKAAKPQTANAAVMAKPQVSVGISQTAMDVKQFPLVSPVSTAQARRRAQALDVTCMARSLVPEGAGVCSVDTNVLNAALLKPTEPSHAVVEGEASKSNPAAGAPELNVGPVSVPPESLAQASPAQLQAEYIGADVQVEPAVHAARFSSSARPSHVPMVGFIEKSVPQSKSERGSNAAVLAEVHATPPVHEDRLRVAVQPACTDPGPVRKKNVHAAPHCMRVPAQGKILPGTPGLPLSPAFPSNVAEVGDTQEPSLDNLLDGGPMSTSESDQRYGDAVACGSDDGQAGGEVVGMAQHGVDASVNDVACGQENRPQEQGGATAAADKLAEEDSEQGAAACEAVRVSVAQHIVARTSFGRRRHSHGDVDSGRSTDVEAQMRVFRDKMLSMEVTQSPYGTSHQCRDLKSGFTFTIKPCVTSAPPINVPGQVPAPEVADELTFVPHMDTCPEHVRALLPGVFQEEFDFRADHLHGLQKRIDRALEALNGNL